MKSKTKYWILFTIRECPVCGRSDEYRERIYDRPKPVDNKDRYHFEQFYDWCETL